jgi:CheY-like chemotaxis protein
LSQPKCRILCVDDHKDTSDMLSMLLSQEDYDVVCAPSAKEALALAASQEFDLYVLDKRLPDSDGLTLCAKLTEITPNVPCMFYSGDAYEIHRHQAIEAGAAAYVAKPDIEGLIANVHKLLADRECAAAVGSEQ